MNVCVVGAGYVGLITALGLAELGAQVVAVDTDEAKVASLQRGLVSIHEPGLPELLQRQLGARVHFTTSLLEGVAGATLVFVAVNTPGRDDGDADVHGGKP